MSVGRGMEAVMDPIIMALEQQVECYRRLAKLAAQQREFVQNAQTESLLEVLSQRQRVLDQVMELERRIAPAKRQWTAHVGRLGVAERQRAEALMGQTRELLEQITSADREDALMLQQRKLNLGKQINQTRAAGQVNRTYAAGAYGQRTVRMDVGG